MRKGYQGLYEALPIFFNKLLQKNIDHKGTRAQKENLNYYDQWYG
jgi:hypothetical protein